MSAAAALATELGASLDWLAGRMPERGRPHDPARTCVDGAAVRALRRDRGLSEQTVLSRIGLGLGAWRMLLSATHETPLGTLGTLAALAALLGVSCDALLTRRDSRR